MKKTSKLLFLLLLCIIAISLIGCKGKRNVKIEIITDEDWYGDIIEGNANWSPTPTAHKGETYHFGDYKDKLYVHVYKMYTFTAKPLSVNIVEEYEPGFLYGSQSDVKDSDSTTNTYTAASAAYNFGSTEK